MAVDKNLFPHDLAVVAIMKNEAPYVKEWLEYHLLAGVDHFYICDNESSDDLRKVLIPYMDAGLVTYDFQAGKTRQLEFYNNTIKKHKFFCRYMAFIDADEFIYPKGNRSIAETVDEILAATPNAGGVAVNWQCFGANGQDKEDLSRGVLERFTSRAPKNWGADSEQPAGNVHVKTIANPRLIKIFASPHHAVYFEGRAAVNENNAAVTSAFNNPVTADKLVINRYQTKPAADFQVENSDEFDDGILKYRDARRNSLVPAGNDFLKTFSAAKQIDYRRIFNALFQNLSPTFAKDIPREFFNGRMEIFLTCRALSPFLQKNLFEETAGLFFEEAALNAIHKTMFTNVNISDLRLLFSELPDILKLDYSAVEDIRKSCIGIIPQLINVLRQNVDASKADSFYGDLNDLDYLMRMLKTFDSYEHD